MPNTFNATQIGFTPPSSPQGSQVVIGKDITASWEAVGFGADGRPDVLGKVFIYLTSSGGTPAQVGVISLDVAQLVSIIQANPNAPTTFQFQMREFDVCDNGVAKKTMIIASQNYLPAS